MYSKELLKGTLKPIILKLLSDTEKMYGYEIVQSVKQLSSGKIVIKEGSLYPLLHSLAKEGTLKTESVMIGKRLRKYYRLSKKGKTVTTKTLTELHDFIETIQKIINQKTAIMHLQTEELSRIQHYVFQNGLTIPDVQDDIVDHLCCIVENKVREGKDFEGAFQIAQHLISEKDLQQIQKDTHYFLTIKKQLIMIKAIFITGYASAAFLVSGIFFIAFGYILGLPQIIGFAMLLASASIFSLGFLPCLFLHKYKRYVERIKA